MAIDLRPRIQLPDYSALGDDQQKSGQNLQQGVLQAVQAFQEIKKKKEKDKMVEEIKKAYPELAPFATPETADSLVQHIPAIIEKRSQQGSVYFDPDKGTYSLTPTEKSVPIPGMTPPQRAEKVFESKKAEESRRRFDTLLSFRKKAESEKGAKLTQSVNKEMTKHLTKAQDTNVSLNTSLKFLNDLRKTYTSAVKEGSVGGYGKGSVAGGLSKMSGGKLFSNRFQIDKTKKALTSVLLKDLGVNRFNIGEVQMIQDGLPTGNEDPEQGLASIDRVISLINQKRKENIENLHSQIDTLKTGILPAFSTDEPGSATDEDLINALRQ